MNRTKLRSRPLRMLVATAALALAGGLAQTASAMPGGAGHGGGHHGGAMMAGRMLDSVDASAEQKAQIQAIWQAARTDLRANSEARRALHERMRNLLAQPDIDAAAVEVVRQQMAAQHEQTSRRMTQAMIDASKVLTPEQRKQIAERMTQRRAMMERHRAERDALGDGSAARRP
jgi:Spy/CpxP family protein refolding chaperone